MRKGLNATNAVLQVLIPIVLMTVVVVIIEEEEEVGAMVTIEEEEVMTITVEGVDLGVMMEGEAMTITVEGVVVVMVEVVHTEVIKVEKMVVMVKFLLLLPNLMVVVLVETTHPLTVLMVVGMQVMEQKQFLHLQVILVDPIPILHHMGVMWVVMGEIIKGMDGVVVDLGLLLDMTVVTVLVIEVDLVDLLLSPLLQ